MTEAYISIPVPAYTPHPSVPVPQEGAAPSQGRAQAGASSLVQYKSITHTPSDIAKDSLLKMLALPEGDKRHQYDRVCMDFVEYLDHCEQKGFMIKGYDTQKGKILNLPMSYNNRWGPVRRAWLSDKLKRLEFWFEMQEDRPVTMITLTSYQEGLTIPQAWFNLNKSRDKLLKMLRKYCGDIDYFWVPEPHKSGYVHYHMAVFADIPVELENKLRALWSEKYQTGSHTYGLDFAQKENEDKINHLKNYLSKYLEKGFLIKEWSTGLLLFNAHLWDTGFRMYGASKRIREMMNIKDDGDYHREVKYRWVESKPYKEEIRDRYGVLKGTRTVRKDDLGSGYAELEEYFVGKNIIWLETRMQTNELTADNEEVFVDEIVWDRDYIPDWVDNSFWAGEIGILPRPRDKMYHCNWGRVYKGMRFFEQNVPKLRAERVSTAEQDRRRIQRETNEEQNIVRTPEQWRAYRKQQQDGYL